jgi:hypothetical protein
MLAGFEYFCILFRTVVYILNRQALCEQKLLFGSAFQECGACYIHRTQTVKENVVNNNT